jgi:hypothetical protein
MCQADSLDEILVGAKDARHGPTDLRHLQCVCQACTEVISLMVNKYLSFVFKAAEGSCMQDPVAIPLKRSSEVGLALWILSSSGVAALHAVGSQNLPFARFQCLSCDEH